MMNNMTNVAIMMTDIMTNVAIIKHANGQKCLFRVPEGVSLNAGETVICDTKHGECTATCVATSQYVYDDILAMLVEACGATLPLRRVVGRIVEERFEEEAKEG